MNKFIAFLVLATLAACKHPLEIKGEGDIIERLQGHRGCSLEEFRAASDRCKNNEVINDDYIVSYEAVPKPGWTFLHWEGQQCAPHSVAPYCEFNVPASWVTLWDDIAGDFQIPATVAVFGQPNMWDSRADLNTGGVALDTCVVEDSVYAVTLGWPAKPDQIELYDPDSNAWTARSPIPTPRAWLSTSVVNGQCFVIGGSQLFSPTPITTVEVYDPKNDSWAVRSPLPLARSAMGSATADGKIYVIGGSEIVSWSSPTIPAVAIYDPESDSWSDGADMPTPRMGVAVAELNGLIYAAGGSNYGAGLTSDDSLEVYNPKTNTWATLADMPARRNFAAATSLNGFLYVAGGLVDAGDTTSADMYRYDPTNDEWITLQGMSKNRYGIGMASLAGYIYAIGGRESRESIPMKLTERYTP